VLRLVPSGVPAAESLRADAYQLIVSPRPPDGSDILQKRLFVDRYCGYYDAAVRDAPRNRAEYLAAEHATVVYEPRRSLDLDRQLAAAGFERRITVAVPGFSALPAFIRGTALIATAPVLLARRTLVGLGQFRPPVPCPELAMFMIWHARYHQDPAHSWLRSQLEACVGPALAGVGR
jgi:DNA-binding transcriptional LysR family regulator